MVLVKKNSAFTLFEILIVLGIIIFLFAFLVPRVIRYMRQTDITKTELKMNNVKEALMLYKQSMGHFPTKREGNLQALLQRPNVPGSEKWTGPYLDGEDDLIDSWESQFEYHSKFDGPLTYKQFNYYELISVGRSEKEGGEEIVKGQ